MDVEPCCDIATSSWLEPGRGEIFHSDCCLGFLWSVMEKFSNWRDRGTGISPFMPASETGSLVRAVVLLAVVLVKLPVFLAAVAVYFVLPFPSIGRFIVLVLFGFRNCDLTVAGVKKSRVDEINASRPTTNDFVVANYQSPIDALILASMSNASGRDVVVLVPNKAGELYQYGVWGFIGYTLSKNIGVQTSGTKVSNYSSFKNKLVFCFVEGTPSNNKCVLPFVDIAPVPRYQFTFKTVILKLQPNTLTTPLPIIPTWRYLFNLLSNLNKSSLIRAKVFKHDANEIPDYFDFKMLKHCFEMGQLNLIGDDLNIDAKINFYNYYKDYKVKKR